MKRLMAILVLVLAVPAMATVTFTATGTDDGSGKLTIAYSGDLATDLPRGIALRVSASDGAVVDLAASSVKSWPNAFNTFIDYAFAQGNAYVIDTGHPLALATGPGPLAADAADFSISMGVLDQAGAQAPGPQAATLITLVFKKGTADQTTVTISADTLRGPNSGVVGSVLASNLPLAAKRVSFQPTECVKATAPIYADWVAFGKPTCWCYARNCKGDADGRTQGNVALGFTYVFSNDLNVVIAGWNVKEPPKGPGIATIPNGICGDFARDRQGNVALGYTRVFSNDLNILIANWNVKEPPKGPGIADCSATGHYNFFVAP